MSRANTSNSPAPQARQLSLFDMDDGAVDVAQALDKLETSVVMLNEVIESSPEIKAELTDSAVRDALEYGLFMRTANASLPSVQASLVDISATPAIAQSAIKSLAAVESAVSVEEEDADDVTEELDGSEMEFGEDEEPAPNAELRSGGDTRGANGTTVFMAQLSQSRFAPMSPEREAELGYRSLAGDLEARSELVERNMRFMISMARRFIKTGRPFDDLIQAGSEGLMKAAQKFNPELGRFTTVAAWWIRQSIQRSVQKDDNMPMPGYLVGLEAKLRRQAEETQDPADRAALLEKAAEASKHFESRRRPTMSLEQTYADDGNQSMLDMIACESTGHAERLEQHQLVSRLLQFADRLGDQRTTEIFKMRLGMHPDHLGDALSLSEIGDIYSLSRERVRQIYCRAAEEVATAMDYWAKGAENLPAGFRKGLLSPGTT
jgi:RNA polymerase sigma factor (sigma-70 family)